MRAHFRLQSRAKTLELGQRTAIMGILNVTPDSFYDGGVYFSTAGAVAHGLKLLEQGADILDIGGQSTRPQSQPVGADEELNRVIPVLRQLRQKTDSWISVDTYRSDVARVCLDEGADLINDVSAFRMDPAMPAVISHAGVPAVCMHFLESIHPMPKDPHYRDLLADIHEYFTQTIRIAADHGINKDRLVLDPGIGFGKKLEHNLQIMNQLPFLSDLGCAVLVGPSRKSFISKITGQDPENRLEGTAAAIGICVQNGAHIIRVHDVAFFRAYCDVLDAVINS